MKNEKNGNGHGFEMTAEERRAALASMTPVERLQYEQAEKMLAEQRAANALASVEQRARVNAESQALEKMRQANEAREVDAAARRAWSARCTVAFEMRDLPGAPVVPIEVEVMGDTREGGPHRIAQVKILDDGEACRLTLAQCWKPWLDQKAELIKLADSSGLSALVKHVEGRSHAGAYQHVRWLTITKRLLEMCVRRNGTLEDLLERGIVKLTDAGIEVDPTPLKTTLDATAR